MSRSQASEPPGFRSPLREGGFLAFLEGRPEAEKWELIDGEPVQKMNPASIVHNRIAANLERQLNKALAVSRPDLDALREAALGWDGDPHFRPIADVAVVSADATLQEGGNPYFFDRFFLAAEVLSASNRPKHISRKRELYAAAPDCLHVLILSQDGFVAEVWSRSHDWQGRVFRSADDVLALPEFGFSCRLADLYRGTPVR